jgi:hypothetical protein
MNVLSPPSVERNGDPDDLDRMLRAFYKAEMPHPWPVAPTNSPRTVLPFHKPTARRPLFRARLALAASVALIASGALLIPRLFHDAGPAAQPPTPVNPVADDTLRRIEKETLIQDSGSGAVKTIKIEVREVPPDPK